MRRMRLTHAWFWIDRLQAHGPQPPRHAFTIHRVALTLSPGGHPPHTIIRCVRIWLIQQPHHSESLDTLSLGLVIRGGPWPPQPRTLSRHTELGMLGLNQLPLRLRRPGQLFFHPGHLDFALPDLLIQLSLQRRLVLRAFGPSYRENVGHLLLETMFPMGDLCRMYPVRAR